ncbi:hypothetical protein SBRY_70151 [Actinacidiphila bryophytorum]|uniref:Uncharacterized protein n=1 Tax=Actinacidiphila bryophytorum TaxID=1436133 RepID=A0A9W4H705_9ACTN|nr:hypothetical protein SBRY_70151 [Actinacidiphila bryophytorum]
MRPPVLGAGPGCSSRARCAALTDAVHCDMNSVHLPRIGHGLLPLPGHTVACASVRPPGGFRCRRFVRFRPVRLFSCVARCRWAVSYGCTPAWSSTA